MNSDPDHGESRKEKWMNVITRTASAAMLVTLVLVVQAAEPPKLEAPADWEKLIGQPVDLAPWSYLWRADRQVQETPGAYFIPRILKRLERATRRIPIDILFVHEDMAGKSGPLAGPAQIREFIKRVWDIMRDCANSSPGRVQP